VVVSGSIVRHVRGNAVAYVALFLALSGTAWALASNSVKSRHIKNGQVKSADVRDNGIKASDIGDGQVGSAEVRDDDLTGGDVDEASLDGSAIPNLPPDGRVLSSGRVQVDDPGGGGFTQATLVVADDFTINGRCENTGGANISGSITIDSGGSYAVYSTEDTIVGIDLASTSGQNNLLNVSNVDAQRAGTFWAMTDGVGGAIQGTMHATTPGPNTCRFAVSAVGEPNT
jgi:hypothetical protein